MTFSVFRDFTSFKRQLKDLTCETPLPNRDLLEVNDGEGFPVEGHLVTRSNITLSESDSSPDVSPDVRELQ